MAEGPTGELQQGIRDVLLSSTRIGDLTGGQVIDGNPPNATPPVPSIVFGETQESSQKFDGVTVYVFDITLHTWRGDNGRLWPVRDLNHSVIELLDDRTLFLPTYGEAVLSLDLAIAQLDPDGLTGHGVLTFSTEVQVATEFGLRHG